MKAIVIVLLFVATGCTTTRRPTDLELLKRVYADLETLEPVLGADDSVPAGFLSKDQLELMRFRGVLNRKIKALERKSGLEQ